MFLKKENKWHFCFRKIILAAVWIGFREVGYCCKNPGKDAISEAGKKSDLRAILKGK